MIPASVAIERAGIDVDVSGFEGVAFEIMPRWMRATVGERIEGVTLGTRIFLAHDVFEAVVIGERPDVVAHELVHVSQWSAGAVPFLRRYISDYVRLRVFGLPHHAAYLGISYEAAAYEVGRSYGWDPG